MADCSILVVRSPSSRSDAIRALTRLDLAVEWEVSIRPHQHRRTLRQNSALHAALTDISRQVEWGGGRLDVEDWKRIFTAALHHQRVVPGLEGGFVVLHRHTRDMNRAEVAELLEYLHAWGAQRGVVFRGDAGGEEEGF